jgi:hypothetical protein
MPPHLIRRTNPNKHPRAIFKTRSSLHFHPRALQGFAFVEYCEISSAVAAKAAMDSALPPAPEQRQRSPPVHRQQRHAQLFEMGFAPQVRQPYCCNFTYNFTFNYSRIAYKN